MPAGAGGVPASAGIVPPTNGTNGTQIVNLSNWYSVEEAGSLLALSTRSIMRYVNSGRLRGESYNGRLRIDPESVSAFRNESEESPQAHAFTQAIQTVTKGLAAEQKHTESMMSLTTEAQKGLNSEYRSLYTELRARCTSLESQLDDYRAREREWILQEREFRIQEKKLDHDLAQKTELIKFGKSIAPQLFALVSSHLNPNEAGPTEAGIASWLQSLGDAKALELASMLHEGQRSKIVEIYQKKAWAPGELAGWLRSLEPTQVQQIAARLNPEQVRGLFAYHEAAGRLKGAGGGALAGALGAMGAGALMGAMGGESSPAQPAASSPAAAPAASAQPKEEGVWLTKAQAQSFSKIFAALFSSPEHIQRAVLEKMPQAEFEAFLKAFQEVKI